MELQVYITTTTGNLTGMCHLPVGNIGMYYHPIGGITGMYYHPPDGITGMHYYQEVEFQALLPKWNYRHL